MDTKEDTSGTYSIRPPFDQKFNPPVVKECIKAILIEELGDKVYNVEEAHALNKSLTEIILNKVKELGYERYKFIIQVVLGEQKGGGVKGCSRCLWDADTDNFTSEVFCTESIFCLAAVYGIYYY